MEARSEQLFFLDFIQVLIFSVGVSLHEVWRAAKIHEGDVVRGALGQAVGTQIR